MAENNNSFSLWPTVLSATAKEEATLCLSSFGTVLFNLQRNLIDQEVWSMGIVKAYYVSCLYHPASLKTTQMHPWCHAAVATGGTTTATS